MDLCIVDDNLYRLPNGALIYDHEPDIGEILRRESLNDRILLICRGCDLAYARGRLSGIKGASVRIVETDERDIAQYGEAEPSIGMVLCCGGLYEREVAARMRRRDDLPLVYLCRVPHTGLGAGKADDELSMSSEIREYISIEPDDGQGAVGAYFAIQSTRFAYLINLLNAALGLSKHCAVPTELLRLWDLSEAEMSPRELIRALVYCEWCVHRTGAPNAFYEVERRIAAAFGCDAEALTPTTYIYLRKLFAEYLVRPTDAIIARRATEGQQKTADVASADRIADIDYVTRIVGRIGESYLGEERQAQDMPRMVSTRDLAYPIKLKNLIGGSENRRKYLNIIDEIFAAAMK